MLSIIYIVNNKICFINFKNTAMPFVEHRPLTLTLLLGQQAQLSI